MSYTPTIWIDHVTTLGPTNLNKLENGLAAAAGVADGAQSLAAAAAAAAAAAVPKTLVDAKGDLLAGIANDTIGRLPAGANDQILVADVAQVMGMRWATPPALTSVLVDAKGDLLAGSADDVLARLPVGSNGQLLTADSAQTLGMKWATPVAVGYGTTLPASPTDLDEFILVDSLTLPTYQWRFKYLAGISDAYKWICVGGAPVHKEVASQEQSTATSGYVDLATSGPTFTIPRAGIWQFVIGVRAFNAGGSQYQSKIGLHKSGALVMEVYLSNFGIVVGSGHGGWSTTVAASDVMLLRYGPTVNPTAWANRYLQAIPVRVS